MLSTFLLFRKHVYLLDNCNRFEITFHHLYCNGRRQEVFLGGSIEGGTKGRIYVGGDTMGTIARPVRLSRSELPVGSGRRLSARTTLHSAFSIPSCHPLPLP